ncbi:phage antirepressor [Nocardia asiatica]
MTPFDYEGATVRTVAVDGEPWFVLADLCKVLGIGNAADVRRRLDEAGIDSIDIRSSGQMRSFIIVSEPNMYEVVIRSDKPGAIAFRRWITAEVLPSIRKTGGYSMPAALPDRKALALMVIEAEEAREVAEARVAELEPKADLADTYLIADGGARLVREAAKLFGMKERDLRRFLVDEGLLFTKHAQCGDVQYDHYAEFSHHFKARETLVNHSWGTCTHYTIDVLPRGMDLIRRRLKAATARSKSA